MKYIKTYEDTIEDRLPQLYDYVICQSFFNDKELSDFVNNHIGQIIEILPGKEKQNGKIKVSYDKEPLYQVQYNDKEIKTLSYDGQQYFTNKSIRHYHLKNIKLLSKDKEELENIIKYNL